MEIAKAQADMRAAYVGGSPGVLVSGLVWLVAGWLWDRSGVESGFTALFVGGILIFPASLLVSRLVFRAPKVATANPLERLALESTFTLFAGSLLAYCFLRVAPELAFPAMAVAIGVRYFVFRTVYGSAIFWVLGGALATLGAAVALTGMALPVNLALIVGALEVAFSALILLFGRIAPATPPLTQS